jgi:hypothetical protein
MFLLGAQLREALTNEIEYHRGLGHNVHVIIEHPLFDARRSEQQYYLFQSALQACQEAGVNVTTPTVMFLKSFIKHQVPDIPTLQRAANAHFNKKPKKSRSRYGPPFEKHHIAYLYQQITFPANPTFPHPSNIKNDDEYDAIYLAWLGSLFAAHIPELQQGPVYSDHFPIDDAVWYRHSIFTDALRIKQPRAYVNSVYPPTGLKAVAANWRKNDHGEWKCNVEFMFNQLMALRTYYAHWHHTDPASAEAWLKTVQGKRTQRDKESPTTLLPNYSGQFFCYTGLRRLSAINP